MRKEDRVVVEKRKDILEVWPCIGRAGEGLPVRKDVPIDNLKSKDK